MSRLPFDPSKMAQPPEKPPRRSAPDVPLTVSQLAEKIGLALRDGLPPRVRVIGEVSNFGPGSHWYFVLKDAGAVVNCVMFASSARRVSFEPRDGMEVVVTGRVEFWSKGGRTSIVVERIEPVGAGALELAFRALSEELRKLGWFDPARKRPIPVFPRRVAVVTSRSGAAIEDVLDTMRRRCPAVAVSIVDVRVQGDGAAAEVAAAVHWLSRRHRALGVDAVLVTRGGGSIEDLWAFNERVVAEAIVKCEIPVVAAIGHESDTAIAELVADLRCATPTQAAMRLAPDRASLAEQVDSTMSRLRAGLDRAVREGHQGLQAASRHLRTVGVGSVRMSAGRLERLAGALETHRPAAAQARRESALHSVIVRLNAAIHRTLRAADPEYLAARLTHAWAIATPRARQRLASAERQLSAVGPLGVLARGFSVTMRSDGRIVRSAGEVRAGDVVHTRVWDGQFDSTVDGTSGAPARPARRPRLRSSDQAGADPDTPSDSAPQLDLFGRGS